MADIKTIRDDKDIDLILDVFGSSFYDIQSYDKLREAQVLTARRKANVALLKAFDEFCLAHDLKYFAYGKTLRGAVSYQDFLPGDGALEIGMRRGEYEKLSSIYQALSEEEKHALSWKIVTQFPGKYRGSKLFFPSIQAKHATPVTYEGELVYGKDNMPMTELAAFDLGIFEQVPDDFFTKKKYFRQMKRRNDIMKRCMLSRNLSLQGAGTKGSAKGPDILYRAIPLKLASWAVHHRAKKYQNQEAAQVTRMVAWRSLTVPIEDIGDLQRMPFAGIEIYAPVRPDIWAREPIYETTPELKRLQEDAKLIVHEIDRICAELGIRYFACGGTMLGYVRHGGFIPWDDDIDIGMLRADYEVFKAKAGEIIDAEKFFLQTRATDPNIPYLFTKVRMEDTEYITDYNKFRDFHKGICVDVFPFDYIPNDFNEQIAFREQVLAASKEHNRIVNRQYPESQTNTESERKGLDWMISHINGRILAKYYWSKSLDETQAAYDAVATTYDDQAEELGLEYVASFVPTYTMAKVEDLYPAQRVNFDGLELMLPKSPEKFLAMQYGNYMVMPYPHQRAGHDLLLWSDAEGVGGGREAEEREAERRENAAE